MNSAVAIFTGGPPLSCQQFVAFRCGTAGLCIFFAWRCTPLPVRQSASSDCRCNTLSARSNMYATSRPWPAGLPKNRPCNALRLTLCLFAMRVVTVRGDVCGCASVTPGWTSQVRGGGRGGPIDRAQYPLHNASAEWDVAGLRAAVAQGELQHDVLTGCCCCCGHHSNLILQDGV